VSSTHRPGPDADASSRHNGHGYLAAGRTFLVIAAIVSVVVVRSLKADSTGLNVFLTVWLLLPYAGLAVLLMARAPRATVLANCLTTLLVVAGGCCFWSRSSSRTRILREAWRCC